MKTHIVRSALCLTALGWTASCAAEGDPDLPEAEEDQLEGGGPISTLTRAPLPFRR